MIAFEQWWQNLIAGHVDSNWVVLVFSIVFLTMLANFISNRFFNRLADQLMKTRNLWDDLLLLAARKPVALIIWVIGGSWVFTVIDSHTGSNFMSAIEPVRRVLVIIAIAWFMTRFIRRAEIVLVSPDKTRKPMDQTTVGAMGKLLRASIFITSLLVVLQNFGYSISGVLAFGGIGGLAIGFAAKDMLANFFGGLMVYMDGPFKVGDWIRSPDQDIEGTVEDIGWRQTRIRTFDLRPLYVPNATFSSISVENPSRMTNRRIYETIGLRYDDAFRIKSVVADVKSMLLQHPDIDTNKTLMVNLNSFGESSLEFFIYTFTLTTDWAEFHEVKQDVMSKIIDIVQSHEADFAFPTRTLHLSEAINIAETGQS